MASAQEPPPVEVQDSAAPAAPQTAEPPQATGAPTSTDPSGCKGLEEKPCRKNSGCYWIVPKEPDKSGSVKPPYCHKRGPAKKAKTTGAATPQGAAQPAAPASEQAAPPAEQPPPAPAGETPN